MQHNKDSENNLSISTSPVFTLRVVSEFLLTDKFNSDNTPKARKDLLKIIPLIYTINIINIFIYQYFDI